MARYECHQAGGASGHFPCGLDPYPIASRCLTKLAHVRRQLTTEDPP